MESIKITSGKFRGRSIKSPGSKLTHPMGSREKLALFNMIADYLPDSEVLDVYAGSGALGIEALSRGAKSATFVEKSPKIASIIKKNLEDLELPGCTTVMTADTKSFALNEKFDIIIADPPYDNFEPLEISHLAEFLKNTGVFMLSHPGEAPKIDGLELQKTRQYAKAHISIYKIN